MRTIDLPEPDDFEQWRLAARTLLRDAIPPEQVVWIGESGDDLFANAAPGVPAAVTSASAEDRVSVPRSFVDLGRRAICHSDPQRFALLYALLWRVHHRRVSLDDAADPLMRRINGLVKAVDRDMHKMRAFVRFRDVEGRYVAWFEPDHHIVRMNASFFVRRFASMSWSILTPERSIHWDRPVLHEGPAAQKTDGPVGDTVEEVWKAYYTSIFNPARVKVGAMLNEMPKKYWKNLPEAELIPGLISGAEARERAMVNRAARAATPPV